MDALHYHISRLNVRVATVHSPPPAGKHGLDGGQIAGIIIGVLLALAAVAAAGLLLMRRQKRVRASHLCNPNGLQATP